MTVFLRDQPGAIPSVFLRPQPAATPVEYQRQVGGSALVTLPRRQLAIYTMKGTPNQGPAGATGPAGPQGAAGTNGTNGTDGVDGIDQNSLFDTIIASAAGEYELLGLSGSIPETTFRAPYALDLTSGYVRISLTTAPTGSSLIVDVHMNGVTLFSTLLSIDATETTSVTALVPAVLSVLTIPDDAYFEVFITQIGSTTPGTGLKVAITGIKAS